MESQSELPFDPMSSYAEAAITNMVASEHIVLYIPGHHPIPSCFILRRRLIHATYARTTETRRPRSVATAGGGLDEAQARLRCPTEHILDYAINAVVALLSGAGRPPKIFVLATLLSFALAFAATTLKLQGGRPRAVLAIRALAAASVIVMFSTHVWIVAPEEYRWISLMFGVFLSICIFQRWLRFIKERILSFVAADRSLDTIPIKN